METGRLVRSFDNGAVCQRFAERQVTLGSRGMLRLEYAWGFSWRGLIVFLLVMLPNVLYFWLPAPEMKGKSRGPKVLTYLEHGSQAVFLLFLILLTTPEESPIQSPYVVWMGVLLAMYYLLWGFFFAKRMSLPVWLGLAVFPVAYFMLAELWLHIHIALIPTAIFGIAHLILS